MSLGRATLKTKELDYGGTHRDIVERCKRGERQAQFELYRLYSQAMYNVCLRMIRNEPDAEDLLQNSFIDVFSNLESFRFESSIGAWIKRIVVNNCINFLKKRRLAFSELNENLTHVPDVTPEPTEYPLSVDTVHHAINQLPDGYRVVFSLYLLEGYDHQEIGEILGITEATSKSQYSRARKKLKEILHVQPEGAE
ncbi:MAG: RNA polymerase sigma factor [Saprospirales bacterium]|nr:RNA polymerase sigma factor [Saprospirales bacterium]